MKFSDFNYQRPNIEALQQSWSTLLQNFNNAQSATEQQAIIDQINAIRSDFDTMLNLAYIRYSIDTTNAAYEEEQNFFDNNSPLFQSLIHSFYKTLVVSKFRDDLEQHYGKHLFNIAEATLHIFDDSIIADMQHENQLTSEYIKLMASAKIMFEGEERNLAGLTPFEMSPDRSLRKRAAEAKWQFMADNTEKIDSIYDQQVKLRHKMAQKLGFKNFVELGYRRMLRTDYDAAMVANYRQQVLETVVPLALDLRQRQAKRLGLDSLKYYDLNAHFQSGNPKPKGSPDWILANGKKMYQELSKETGDFFDFMLDNELLDVETRKGKAGGGYCTYVSNYKSPFIFSNFNGTADDINVLTHEAGHAFQVYMSRDWSVPEYQWPTYEACEIHSMSMEFFAWPWMEQFFGAETEKFKYEHLSGSIIFLPYGVSVDEFQHFVYENPDATPTERKQAWRNIERKYMPWLDYDGNEFLENGGFWQKQAHIFANPFYYIDYTLAQICAFQFWKKADDNREDALVDYIRLCKAGGSQPFLQLVEYAKLESPFDNGCIAKTLEPIKAFLAGIDDQSF